MDHSSELKNPPDKPFRRVARPGAKKMRKELIKISEFQRRRWGENGTPPCPQAIRNYIRNGLLPGEQIGKLWYIDWAAYNKAAGNDLIAMVLKGAA
ncbi:Uncharacterized protein ALO91_01412 [Pseudomonas syringae pv. aceris]|uniref:Uncharacterized protein n=2 Tax=Pseudomonas syringae TaxID=317 RepID=A0A0P9H9Z0_PSESX|nr:Uncharacterized protein ALO91_01412 [Pseudomonas syringae pv. aceris]